MRPAASAPFTPTTAALWPPTEFIQSVRGALWGAPAFCLYCRNGPSMLQYDHSTVGFIFFFRIFTPNGGMARGLQQRDLSLRLSTAPAGSLLSSARQIQSLAERCALGLQPLFLRLRRPPLSATYAPLHCRQLCGRSVRRPGAAALQGRHGSDHSGEFGPAGLVQVRRLFLLQT